jgi:hypothetical protein
MGAIAAYWNASHHSTGHVWQGRYYSCPLDEPHLWEALRYTELNPVRAGTVDTAAEWEWSSAIGQCSGSSGDEWLAMEMWRRRWCDASWRGYLDAGPSESKLVAIRHYTHWSPPWEGRSSSVRWKGKPNDCWPCKSVGPKRRRLERNAKAYCPSEPSGCLSANFTDGRFLWGLFRSVSEIEFCTLYVVAERWILGCILRFMHAKNHFSDTLSVRPLISASPYLPSITFFEHRHTPSAILSFKRATDS